MTSIILKILRSFNINIAFVELWIKKFEEKNKENPTKKNLDAFILGIHWVEA